LSVGKLERWGNLSGWGTSQLLGFEKLSEVGGRSEEGKEERG
jgi:hypothetical protein